MSCENRFFWVAVAILSICGGTAQATLSLRGYAQTELYLFEDASQTQHQQLYQTLSFQMNRLAHQSLSLVGHLRYQGDAADDFAESGLLKLHALYLRWSSEHLDLRLGRQFLAEGVGVGTYDAAKLRTALTQNASLTFWGGLAATPDRRAELLKPDEAPAFGLALRGNLSSALKIAGSYLREERAGALQRHKAGISANATLPHHFSALLLLYGNLEGKQTLDRFRALLRYTPAQGFRTWGEFALGTPALPPNSPFQNLDFDAVHLLRVGFATQVLKDYWIGVRAQSLLSERAQTTLGVSCESSWGVIGYRQRLGANGEESGGWGAARLRLSQRAQVYGSADYSVYRFEDYDEDEQAALQLGVLLTPLKSLQCDASLQTLKNQQFESDIRGLLRIKWSFAN